MGRYGARVFWGAFFLFIGVLASSSLGAQTATGSLSGSVTDAFGKAVAGAKVSVKNVATEESSEATTDLSGHYNVPNLAAGDYEVTVSSEGKGTTASKVTLAAGAAPILNLSVTAELPSAPMPDAR